MVDQEHLEALDAMLWLGSSHRAAGITFSNQSTVVRRARAVLSIFGGTIQRHPSGWTVQGADPLLRDERRIHQHFRFQRGCSLRLHAPFWSSPALRVMGGTAWISNPPDPWHCCENPLELLAERIIDACLLTPTQLLGISSELAEQLLLLPIHESEINLVAWPGSAPAAQPGASAAQVAAAKQPPSPLHLFPFLPLSCRNKSLAWYQELVEEGTLPLALARLSRAGLSRSDPFGLAFLTPEMRTPLPLPLLVDPTLAWPYQETLVLLAEHAREPWVAQLVDHLSGRLSEGMVDQRPEARNLPSRVLRA